MTVISGDITRIPVDIIVQQCNCLSIYPHGLAKTIKDVLGVDPYGHRKRLSNNCAIERDRDEVGTCKIQKARNGTLVANLFAQYSPGKPGVYFQKQGADTREAREQWFQLALEDLSEELHARPDVKTIAFPFGIGCGLAGGKWENYNKMIQKWAKLHSHLKVYIVKLPS